MTRAVILLAAMLGLATATTTADPATPRIAIIIDDLGYELAAGRRAIALPGPVSFAILPGAPRTRLLATTAHENGKDVLLHLPMQAAGDALPHDAAGMTLDMSRQHFAESFAAAFASVPYVIGVSNHRGSLVTRHPGHMRWLMEEILQRERVFFIDSYTTHKSVALQLAAEAGVPARRRDVFLDADPSPQTIRREFERLKSLARRQGAAIGIGHPYVPTLEFLEAELPKLSQEGFELVAVSDLL